MTAGAAPAAALTTGWEPDLPSDDTMLLRFTRAWAAALAGPVAALGGRVEIEDDLVITDLGRPAAFFNGAVLLAPPAHGWEDLLARVERALLGHGRGEVELWSPWPTPDLREYGWRLHGHPPLLWRPPLPAPPAPPATGPQAVVEVTDATGVAAWERIAVEAYPFDELRPYRPGGFADERLLDAYRLWLGYDDRGDPVGAGASCAAEGVHVLALGAVAPQARGRGMWTRLLQARLAAYPGLPSASLFSDMSRPGAQGHGYEPLLRFTLWHHSRE